MEGIRFCVSSRFTSLKFLSTLEIMDFENELKTCLSQCLKLLKESDKYNDCSMAKQVIFGLWIFIGFCVKDL